MSDSGDAPAIKDHKGPWDEIVSRTILITPFILLLLGGIVAATLIITGRIRIEGAVPTEVLVSELLIPVAKVAGLLLAVAWVLSLMKFYGSNPVAWIAERFANFMDSYTHPRNREGNQ